MPGLFWKLAMLFSFHGCRESIMPDLQSCDVGGPNRVLPWIPSYELSRVAIILPGFFSDKGSLEKYC